MKLCALVLCLMATQLLAAAHGQPGIKIEVKFGPDKVAQGVELQQEFEATTIDLVPDQGGTSFVTTLDHSSNSKSIVRPFDLVIDWPEPNEIIFLRIGPLSPQTLRLKVDPVSNPSSFKPKDLAAIDGLGLDEESMLQKFFRARRFHRHWRNQLGVTDNEISLRSARIWFDASVNLATRRPQVFGPDREVAAIVSDYRNRALSNSSLAARVKKYFPSAMIRDAEAQIAAAPYQFVGTIPKLVQEMRLDKAKMYNDLALVSYEASSVEDRDAITSKQGITATLLRDNATYIDNLIESKSAMHRHDEAL